MQSALQGHPRRIVDQDVRERGEAFDRYLALFVNPFYRTARNRDVEQPWWAALSLRQASFRTITDVILRVFVASSEGGKTLGLINWWMKITFNDGRSFVGKLLARDRHTNLLLADCEELERVRPQKKPRETETAAMQEMKTILGLVIW